MKEDEVKEGILMALVCVGVLIGIYCCANAFDCWRSSVGSSFETKFNPVSGCFVKTQQGWVPYDRWRPQ